MSAFNKRDAYGWVAITFHWLLFLLIVGLVSSGKYSDSLDSKNIMLINIHKQVGMAVFVLMILRFTWRITSTHPASLVDSLMLRVLATLNHWALYAVILGQAAIGVAMSQLANHSVSFLGVVDIPSVVEHSKNFLSYVPSLLIDSSLSSAKKMRELHYWGGILIMALVALHVLAALTHHMIFRDDTLRRMFYNYMPGYAKGEARHRSRRS